MYSVKPLLGFDSSGSIHEIPRKSLKTSRISNAGVGSRYVILSNSPADPQVTISHQSQWAKHSYLIAALSVATIAALGLAAYVGYRHLNPQIPVQPPVVGYLDKATAAFDFVATCEKFHICNPEIFTARSGAAKIVITAGCVSSALFSITFLVSEILDL